jgi:transcriptional regulator with XRE-family HTH domain
MVDADDLGTFLRARREQLQPADVGLPQGHARRRTPGLRREELATLAGVSIDYLVRLEQGRDVNPSSEVLAALAGALRLTDDERMHMMKLALRDRADAMCPTATPADRSIAPTVRLLLERLGSTPAFVLGAFNDVLAWNQAWEQVVAPLGMLDGDSPNIARYVLTHEQARHVMPDWELAVDEQVARLRVAFTRWSADPRLTALLEELSDLPAFSSRWPLHDVEEKRRGTKRLVHPDVGPLRIAYEVLLLPDPGEQRLTTWLAADDATGEALATLTTEPVPTSPARLKVVGQS